MSHINIAKIELNNILFKGTMDFYVISKILEDLRAHGFDFKVVDIFKAISNIDNLNMYVIASIVLNSIIRKEDVSEEVIETNFKLALNNSNTFPSIFIYVKTLLDKCIPSSKIKDLDELEFEEDDIEVNEDWDFDYMEYLWYLILKRTDDFYSITPRVFFKQLDIYKKMNNIKTEDDNVKYM